MKKKSFIQELGSKYLNEMYTGAMFRAGDTLYYVRAIGGQMLVADTLPIEGEQTMWERKEVSNELLQDFSTFQYPPLGYRQADAGKFGNCVTYVTARRTALRGLRMDQLNYVSPAIYSILYPDDVWGLVPRHLRTRAIFAPTFTPFSVGLAKLVKGETAGFAISNNVACAMSCSGNRDRIGDILFRGKIVGHIDSQAQVTIINKIMHRDSMKSLLTT